jgi:hypothetical protein
MPAREVDAAVQTEVAYAGRDVFAQWAVAEERELGLGMVAEDVGGALDEGQGILLGAEAAYLEDQGGFWLVGGGFHLGRDLPDHSPARARGGGLARARRGGPVRVWRGRGVCSRAEKLMYFPSLRWPVKLGQVDTVGDGNDFVGGDAPVDEVQPVGVVDGNDGAGEASQGALEARIQPLPASATDVDGLRCVENGAGTR